MGKKRKPYTYMRKTGRPIADDQYIGKVFANEWKCLANVGYLNHKGHSMYYLLENISTGQQVTLRADRIKNFTGKVNKVKRKTKV